MSDTSMTIKVVVDKKALNLLKRKIRAVDKLLKEIEQIEVGMNVKRQ